MIIYKNQDIENDYNNLEFISFKEITYYVYYKYYIILSKSFLISNIVFYFNLIYN